MGRVALLFCKAVDEVVVSFHQFRGGGFAAEVEEDLERGVAAPVEELE